MPGRKKGRRKGINLLVRSEAFVIYFFSSTVLDFHGATMKSFKFTRLAKPGIAGFAVGEFVPTALVYEQLFQLLLKKR